MKHRIQEIEKEKNAYLGEIQQKENELKQFKESVVLEHNQILEASRKDIMNQANAEHNRILGKKDEGLQEFKEKYSEMERRINNMQDEYPGVVRWEAKRLAQKTVDEKDQEIQRLQEQLNQLLSQQTSQGTEMEMEEPKTKPERIEEERKANPHSTHGMQTRSQGPPSFGEQIQQEVYDPLGNLISKRTGYIIPNMGEYGAYDVVVNLLSKGTGATRHSRLTLLIMLRRWKTI